jgi:predicted deacylase
MAKNASAKKSSISVNVDFDRPGRQVGYLRVMHSGNKTSGGAIPYPIAVIGKGKGPTVFISSGNHGNEYEGQIISGRLIRELDPDKVDGRIIIMPALNYLAVREDQRVSDVDGVNMNRIFPGDPDGGPTLAAAHFVETEIVPVCDVAMDLHSGGATSRYLPCAYVRSGGSKDLRARKLAATEAFAAPLTVVVFSTASTGSLSAACDRNNVAMVATELGGANTVTKKALQIGTEGVFRVLRHLEILAPDKADEKRRQTRFVSYPDSTCMTMAPASGLFEPYCQLGDMVSVGQPAGCIHSLEAPELDPVEVNFNRDGMIVVARIRAPVKRGDYVFNVGVDVDRNELI